MARDAVSITSLALSGGTAEAAGTTIVVANGANIAAAGETARLLLVVKNTNASDRVVTIKAGVNPPAALAGQGDLAVTVAATSGVQFITLESARFAQADGSINVDFAASMTGSLAAYRLPKGL